MTAKVQLTDVTVIWVSDSGKVFEVTETVTTNSGASWPRKWGVVLEGSNVAVNDVVSVVGEYSDKLEEYQGKLEEYQGKHFTKRTLWNPIVTRSGATVDAPVTPGDAPF